MGVSREISGQGCDDRVDTLGEEKTFFGSEQGGHLKKRKMTPQGTRSGLTIGKARGVQAS